MLRRRAFLGVITTAMVASGATSSFAQAKKGGAISVAIIGEPPTLDPMLSTADVVSTVTQHIFETLFTFDAHWNVVPLLATAMPQIGDDGKTYLIAIRQGITFHDGSAMNAHDVVASLKRWTQVATRGKGVASSIAAIEAPDDFSVKLTLSVPYSPLLALLAFSNSAAIIVPRGVIAPQLKQLVGTGPYKLVAHKPDQYIQVARFDGYKSRTEPSSAASGARKQYLDEIRFVPVPDDNTRVEGLISGQFAFAEGLSDQAYGRLAASKKAKPELLAPFGWPIFAMNMRKGLMSKLGFRQAVQAALAPADMLAAAFGDAKFYKVDGALFPEGFVWHNEAGVKLYNQANPAKGAKLLKAGGYKGTTLRILTSHQYEFHYQMAVVAKAYLEQAGFKVHLDVVDWATLTQRRNNPDLWDIFITHSPFLPDPSLTSLFDKSSQVGWDDPAKEKVLGQLNSVTDMTKRKALFAELQNLVFEQVPFYKVGDFNAVDGESRQLTGVPPTPWPFFWNAQLG